MVANIEEITVAAPPRHPPAPHRSALRTFISELNPLQYLPVIGTIYRAVTGDTIPETARMVGSLVASGLISGPIGMAMSLGAMAVERVTGIDPERVGQHLLASVGIGPDVAPAITAKLPVSAAPVSKVAAWSDAQLSAYGVARAANGELHKGAVTGADVLNELEITRVRALA